jgi:uncharacterized protein (DUF433 family)
LIPRINPGACTTFEILGQNATDAHILEGHPDLCAADLVNAFSYADTNLM